MYPYQQWIRVSIALHPHQHFLLPVFWILAILIGVEWYLIIVLIFISLITYDLFTCLLTCTFSPFKVADYSSDSVSQPQYGGESRKRYTGDPGKRRCYSWEVRKFLSWQPRAFTVWWVIYLPTPAHVGEWKALRGKSISFYHAKSWHDKIYGIQ